MRYLYANTVSSEDVGKRVTVRYRTSDGKASDVVGILEACTEEAFRIRRRSDDLVTVDRAAVVAAKVVQSRTRGGV